MTKLLILWRYISMVMFPLMVMWLLSGEIKINTKRGCGR